jgi:hypothetical protein
MYWTYNYGDIEEKQWKRKTNTYKTHNERWLLANSEPN